MTKEAEHARSEFLQMVESGATTQPPAETQTMLNWMAGFYKGRNELQKEEQVLKTLLIVSERDFGNDSQQAQQAKNSLRALRASASAGN